ncbi:MAG: ferritin-like domain-containing protein [Deltaproteobacteria bacterium]|nr:ferritin-like domain-containing protein [Deltaproteobacteria bacterium]
MRLASLRHRMLLAMGLPACWSSTAPAPVDPVKPPQVAGAPTPFDPSRCPKDAIVETVCGKDEQRPRCGPGAPSLATIDQTHLHVTAVSAHAADFSSYAFDQPATDGYRTYLGLDDPRACCYSACTALHVGPADPVTPRPGFHVGHRCIPAPPSGTAYPAATAAACPSAIRLDGEMRPFASYEEEDRQCCYEVLERLRPTVKGRAARVDGEARVAAIAAGDGWSADVAPCVEGLPRALRDRLAAAWLEAAQMEHASVASFANLANALLASGAPPELLAATHAAALDEIRHARVAFAIASAYAGVALRPGAFAAARRLRPPATLAELARETFVDGCVNETAASVEAAYAGERALDPVIAGALREIAVDEARHAELAWAIVAWCVRREPAILEALRGELAALGRPAARDADLAAHGVGTDPTAWSDAMREVVAPCLAALAA